MRHKCYFSETKKKCKFLVDISITNCLPIRNVHTVNCFLENLDLASILAFLKYKLSPRSPLIFLKNNSSEINLAELEINIDNLVLLESLPPLKSDVHEVWL